MNMECDPILEMRITQGDLKVMFERNADLARRNPFPASPIAIADSFPVPVPKNKYHNIKVEYEGMKFDSKHELKCWRGLELRYRAREIFMLERQVSYDLIVSGKKIGRFTADFRWFENDQEVVADAKSPATRKETAYRLRKRIFEAQYAPLVILEL